MVWGVRVFGESLQKARFCNAFKFCSLFLSQNLNFYIQQPAALARKIAAAQTRPIGVFRRCRSRRGLWLHRLHRRPSRRQNLWCVGWQHGGARRWKRVYLHDFANLSFNCDYIMPELNKKLTIQCFYGKGGANFRFLQIFRRKPHLEPLRFVCAFGDFRDAVSRGAN